jgi:hypothetical protein
MALPSGINRTADLPTVTKRTIGEQIQEYFATWAERAMRGNDLKHDVPPQLAVDSLVVDSEGAIRVRLGELEFQVPDVAEYTPFPLAFACTKCGLYRSSKSPDELERNAPQYRSACPTGARGCVDDWEQIDVVLTHWSGEVEAITPEYRHWSTARQEISRIRSCAHCNEDRFYLRRPPGALGGWYFECVSCHQPRQILLRDETTLKKLGALIDQGLATWAEVNMEPVSYRASAAYYVHNDRLLVFKDDQHLVLLGDGKASDLQALVSSRYNYPASHLSDADKERILREAGRDKEWSDYINLQNALKMIESVPGDHSAISKTMLDQIADKDRAWSDTVFKAHATVARGISDACRGRRDYVRKHDPLRMVVEHLTLEEEKLRGGQMADGKLVSVDVAILDQFLRPDGLSEAELKRQEQETKKRLGALGIAEMRLLRGVTLCEYSFAYSRTSASPTVVRDKAGTAEMPVRLRLFDRVAVGDNARHPVLCTVQENEGFYVKLDEDLVRSWLANNGVPLPPADPAVKLGGQLIEDFELLERGPGTRFTRFLDEYRREHGMQRRAYPLVYTLLHTMSHHLIDTCSSMSGLDLGSFGEHLFVPDLAFLVYRRGTTMDLGNLSSMWRDRGDPDVGNQVLEHMLKPSSLRCGSESVCNHRGGACPDCVLIPETACVTRNELLSRSVLVGRGRPRFDASQDDMVGYLDLAASRSARA